MTNTKLWPGLGRWPVGNRKMGIGFMLPVAENAAFGKTPRFSDMVEMCQVAEEVGYDAIWVADHFVVRPPVVAEGTQRGVWEGWTALAGLAASTKKITLGVFVTCLGWRNPGIVAKMAEMIDEISGGRFVLGIGAGWHEPDYDMFGLPFDHRVSRFEDAIQIVAPMLREGKVDDYQGRFYQAKDAVNYPRGPRANEGGVPILVGTNSPRMMRLTATYADAWNSDWHHDTSSFAPLMSALDEACHEVGRDPKTLVRTGGSNIAMPGYLGIRQNPITGDIESIAEQVAKFRDIGLRHYVAGLDPGTPQSLEQFGRVIELLDKHQG